MLRVALALVGCTRSDTDSDPPIPVDLTERLGPGEVRAGVVTDERALFGGISAEGRAGDVLIYNDRARFVIQGAREGSYYVQVGGGVIDADWVRPEGAVGGDAVDEWAAMLGFGRLLLPDAVTVVSDGADGTAVVRVTGTDVPLALLGGVLENADFIQDLGVQAVTEYRLAPDTPLMEVRTTVTATTPVSALAIGDILMGAPEMADAWTDGSGLEPAVGDRRVTGYLSEKNDGAVAILARGDALRAGGAADLITELTDTVLGFAPSADLEPGESLEFTRWYGVAPDLATLTDAAFEGDFELREGVVTAPDGPVAGARVHVLVDGAPFTVAVTGPDGSFRAKVPAGAAVSTLADGRGRGLFTSLPAGSGSWPAFASAPVHEAAAAAMSGGAPSLPLAEGRGMGAGPDGLALGQPATVRVSVADGLPFTVRVGAGAPDGVDRRLQRGRPNGLAAAGWSRGEPLELAVEPGTWDVLVHRGMRYELFTATVDAVAGQAVAVEASLPRAFEHPGFLLGDPHAHASPSGDGDISMEERIVVHAAAGIELHFGSDHDRVADYRPLVDALGLRPRLRSVVADEVSSVIRGHLNAYPLTPDPALPNQGAVQWWTDIPANTDALVQSIRARHGEVIVQANHPLDSGVGEAADWSPGFIGSPTFWTDDLDAMEVLNDAAHEEYFAIWLDLVARGHAITPVGVSDSHGHFQSVPGLNGTFIGLGDELDAATDAALIEAFRAHRTVASLGVFLDLSLPPGSVLTGPAELEVSARSASWAPVHRLKLWVDGALAQTVEGTTATFALDAAADAVYVVTAEGDSPMLPLSNARPWACSAPYWLDRGGDGYVPSLPPLQGVP